MLSTKARALHVGNLPDAKREAVKKFAQGGDLGLNMQPYIFKNV